jgi:hypothetical protein
MFIKILSTDRKTELDTIEPRSWLQFSLLEKSDESFVVAREDNIFALRAVAWCIRHPNVEHHFGLHLWKPLDTLLSDSNGIGVISSKFTSKGKFAALPRPELKDFPFGWAVLHVCAGHFRLIEPRQAHLEEPHEKLDEWGKKFDFIDVMTKAAICTWADSTKNYVQSVLDLMKLDPKERAIQSQSLYISINLKDSTPPVEKPANANLPTDEPEKLLVKAVNLGHQRDVVMVDLMKIDKWNFNLINQGYENKTVMVWDRDLYLKHQAWKATFKQFANNPKDFQLIGYVNEEWIEQ